MSVAKYGLTALTSFPGSLSLVQLPQPLQEQGTLAKRYETLSRLSRSLVSQRPENLPCNLGSLMRPLLDFDFLDFIVFKEGSSEVLWHSIGAGQFPTPDVPVEETTYWWVYQQKQPLFISDWKQDERFAARREALKRLGFEYRSLCRLPLSTSGRPIGVLSFASFRPHTFSEEEMCFLSMAAEQVSLALANVLQRERLHRAEQDLKRRYEQITFLVDLANTLVTTPHLEDLLRGVTAGVRRVVRSDFSMAAVLDPENGQVLIHCVDPPDNADLDGYSSDPFVERVCSQILSIEASRTAVPEEIETGADKSLARFTTAYVQPVGCLGQTLGFLTIAKHEQAAYTRDEVN